MASQSKTKDGNDSRYVPRQPQSDDTPPHTPTPIHQVSSVIHSRIRTSSRGSSESGRSAHFSGLLRRSRPRPAPIEVSQLTHETPPPTATVGTSPPPPLPTPLLAGCPGREISGAKSDGRGLTCDFEEPPVLDCPDDLSKTEFHEHPLAHHIELEKGWEKHQLALYGLILPAKVDNGTPTYTWESDPEEQEEADLNEVSVLTKEAKTPAKPPTPTERPRTPSNILQKVKSFANFVATSDLEKNTPELPTLKELLDQFGLPPTTLIEPAPRTFLRPTRSSGSLRPKTPLRSVPSATKLRIKRSTGVDKTQISDPVAPEEMRRVGLDFSQAVVQRRGTADNERISTYTTSLRSHSNLISPSMSSNLPVYLLQPQHPTVYFGKNEAPPKFRLASPRLSPMEYARQYLIAKAKADKEDGSCTVCKPTLIWTWTEGYKEFLLLPQIPKGVQRNFLQDDDKDWKRSDFLKSASAINNNNNNDAKTRSFTPLPLDLAPSSPLLPAHFFGDLQSSTLSTHSRGMSVNSFILDRHLATESKSLHKSAKSPLTDLSASTTNENTDFFVTVHADSESEFTGSLPFLSTPSSSFRGDPGPRQHHLIAYERAASASPPNNTFTAALANPRVSEQSLRDTNRTAGVPTNASVSRPSSAASSQRPIAAPSTPANTEEALQSFAAPLPGTTNDRHRQFAVIQMPRPDSALSYHTVIGPNSPILTVQRDENNVSPSNTDYDGLPPAPVSPLSNSPSSAQTKFVAPLWVTRTLGTHNTLDDAQTQQPIDETFLESISDCEAELADTSSVYSQDSVITVVRHPVAERRHTPLDFMSQARTTGENGQEDLTPRQQESLSSNVTRSRARTLQHSPILPPLSYIPNTQSAHPHASSEPLQEHNIDRRSRAPSSSISTVSTSVTGSIAEQRDRLSTASEASAGSQSLTSVSTSTSRRSQTPISIPKPLPGRSTTSKHVRNSRIEGSSPKAPSKPSHPSNNISQLPALASVAESPLSSPGISLSTTSPAVNSTALSRQKPLPRRPGSIQKDAVTKAIESRNTDLPPLQVRRGRAVNSLDYIPASQIYPKPLRISAMKSPSPASTTPPGSRFASGASTDTVGRSASSLITDVNAEVHREMEEVLSPRTAALVAASKSAEEREDIDTPTRRPLRKLRSLPEPVPWSPPIHPPPNKPLPPIPQKKKKAPSDAPPRTSVDTNYGPGPAVYHSPPIAQAPARPSPSPSVTTSTPDFYDPYPPPRVIWTNGDVTVSDFSMPKRAVRPATSIVATPPYPPTLMDQRQQIRRPESAANLQRLAPAVSPSQSRFLGKVVSMAELKQRRETGFSEGSGSDEAIGLTTFLREDIAAAPASAKERAEKDGKNNKPEKLEKPDKSTEGGKKKLFGKLFRRNRKEGEK